MKYQSLRDCDARELRQVVSTLAGAAWLLDEPRVWCQGSYFLSQDSLGRDSLVAACALGSTALSARSVMKRRGSALEFLCADFLDEVAHEMFCKNIVGVNDILGREAARSVVVCAQNEAERLAQAIDGAE